MENKKCAKPPTKWENPWWCDDLIHSPLDIPMHRPTNQWLNYAKPSPPIRNNATEHAALDVTHDNENMEEQQQNI